MHRGMYAWSRLREWEMMNYFVRAFVHFNTNQLCDSEAPWWFSSRCSSLWPCLPVQRCEGVIGGAGLDAEEVVRLESRHLYMSAVGKKGGFRP